MRASLLGLLALLAASCGAPKEKCDATTCAAGCCDAEGVCQAGGSNDACGTPGTACVACNGSLQCASGICVLPGGSSGGGGGSAAGGGSATGGGTGTGGGSATGGGGATGGGTGTGGGAATGGGAGIGGPGSPDAGPASCTNIWGDRQAQVCLRWTCSRADMSEGTWNGAVATCNAGDVGAVGRANALKVLNAYRFLADLPAVVTDPTRDQAAQECALIQDAANMLSHTPDSGTPCWTASGGNAAGRSNISSGQAVRSIDMYMSDFGTSNSFTLGHRRWLLSNQLGPVGIGGTTGGSCHWVLGGSGTATKRFMAWPPPGPVPLTAINIPTVGASNSVDRTGWSVQTYASADNLADAGVSVVDNGASLPVNVFQLGANYGSRSAIRFVPNGWVSQAGHSYEVTVYGPGIAANPIRYTVDVVSCP